MDSADIGSEASTQFPATRFDRRLVKILEQATAVFYEKGYAAASMRDLARASGISLAGLYHYFESKEKILYLIQKHYLVSLIGRLRQRLEQAASPEDRLRAFILNQFEYFLAYPKALKVLSHEDEVLKNDFGKEISGYKREYYRLCFGITEAIQQEKRLEFNTRTAVLGLLGTMNWMYTWYDPRTDGNADTLARQIGDIFLHGIYSSGRKATRPAAPGQGTS
jgi:TetR/AcrR family transcriptional regulator, cholesterol catabolism regulator